MIKKERIEELEKRVEASHFDLKDGLKGLMEEMQTKLDELETLTKEMPSKIQRAEAVFKTSQEDIIKSHANSMLQLAMSAKKDTGKLTDLESKVRELYALVGQVKLIDDTVTQLTPLKL